MNDRTQPGTSRASTSREQQRRGRRVGDDRVAGGDLRPVREHDRRSAPVAHQHARDAGAEPDLAAALREPGDEPVGQALRAPFRKTVAARRRGDREHVGEAGAESIVGADVDVQAEARKHAARRLALEQA